MNKKKKIGIVGIVGIPANYGGFETLVENLTYHDKQNKYTVYCSSFSYNNKQKNHNGATLKYINLKANGFQSIFYDAYALIHSSFHNDKTLLLGISGAIIIPLIKIFKKSSIIVNVDGIEWKRDKWNLIAKYFLKISEYICIKFCDEIVSDNKGIQEYIFDRYSKKSTIIAYGSKKYHSKSNNFIKQLGLKNNDYAFSVCRIEPENNLHLILDAFKKFNLLKIVIVGNWDNSHYGRKLLKEYKNCKNILMINPIYEINRLNQFRANCKIYVHGHSAGGTNPSLVEAMSLKLPILAYDVNFNRYTLNNFGYYFKDSKQLIEILNDMKNLDLENQRKNIYRTFIMNYSWNKVTNDYKKLFMKD